ncbi:hypothetical protein QLQ12_17765 [Actinoplanes sp. NEAU-A12]|uniref:Uncharacterized protein n=1 Tax=Actinoplanes sandaracinus TaxID=3045177 RepID=A0ABT6WL55_9ACTN|nr:hypothetical protein [Actinoplanes sandaracinus]MDI6100459.1 hypothetical protein [Actinoplanes sandaracinus]
MGSVSLDEIRYADDGVGGYVTSGGARRLWRDWHAAEGQLRATRFRYTLPAGAETI